jgi:hypothetical protein
VAAAAAAVAVSASTPAGAQGRDRAAAERLFEEGRVLTAGGLVDQGCAKFAASEALDPAVGTLLNLASCAQQKGASATAWRRYREAAVLAVDRADPVREAVARRGIEQIERTLSRLTITTASRALPLSAVVRLDGTDVAAAEVGRPFPVDPGAHAVEVVLPGHRPWTTSAVVGPGPAVVVVTVPEADEASPAPLLSPALAPSPAPPTVSPPALAPAPDHAARTWAWVAGGTGVVALGVGVFFGVRASHTWNEITAKCPAGNCQDPHTAGSLASSETDAARDGNVSTVGFAVAGVALAASVILFLVHRERPDRDVAVRTDPRTGLAEASFRFP